MRRISIILLIILTALLTACGAKQSANSKKATVSMFDLRTAMLAADDTFPKMLSVSDSDENPEKLFSYISEDFDYQKLEHFFLSYSGDSENPSGEIVVMALKDTKDVDLAIDALKAHVEHRVKMYEQYDPDSVSKVQKAEIFKKDQYAVLIISEKSENVKKSFEEFIEK